LQQQHVAGALGFAECAVLASASKEQDLFLSVVRRVQGMCFIRLTCCSGKSATNGTLALPPGRGSSGAADDCEPSLGALGHDSAGHRDP